MDEVRKRVNLWMRIEGNDEVHVGTARTIADVPELLRRLADLLASGTQPDELET